MKAILRNHMPQAGGLSGRSLGSDPGVIRCSMYDTSFDIYSPLPVDLETSFVIDIHFIGCGCDC